MRLERPTLLGTAVFASCVAVFIFAGAVWGWRAVGLVSLVGSLRALGQGRVGVGIEGYEPSFHLTGVMARIAASVAVLISLFFIFFAEMVVGFAQG